MNLKQVKDLMDRLGVNQISFIDFETTGLKPHEDHPTEIAIRNIRVEHDEFTHLDITELIQTDYNTLLKLPDMVKVPEFITNLTGIDDALLEEEGRNIYEVAQEIAEFIDDENTLVVAHSANFDLGYLYHHFGITPKRFLCTKSILFLEDPTQKSNLGKAHARLCPNKTFEQTHRALDDTTMLADLFEYLMNTIGVNGLEHYAERIVIEPERPLVFEPRGAKLIDFSVKFDPKPKEDKK